MNCLLHPPSNYFLRFRLFNWFPCYRNITITFYTLPANISHLWWNFCLSLSRCVCVCVLRKYNLLSWHVVWSVSFHLLLLWQPANERRYENPTKQVVEKKIWNVLAMFLIYSVLKCLYPLLSVFCFYDLYVCHHCVVHYYHHHYYRMLALLYLCDKLWVKWPYKSSFVVWMVKWMH